MATNISHNVAETLALGEAWGRAAESGLVIGLTGDLGAGKTHLVKGIARGLGISARVQSPTFSLLNIYSGGRLSLFHLDLYRLETPEQIEAAGLTEYLTPAGVSVIEWVERWFGQRGCSGAPGFAGASALPAARWRWVTIESVSQSVRRFSYEDFGD